MSNEGRIVCVNKIDGNTIMSIPFVSNNTDYQEYLKWIDGYEKEWNPETKLFDWVKTSEGNEPLPADE